MAPEAKINFNQLSVSAHSFQAISNFECISARLCGYWASVMFAKTLDEDFFIWKTVLESISYSEQSFAISIANSSLYSNSKFRFIFTPLRTNSRQSREWNPQPVVVWNLAKGEYGIKTEVEEIQPTYWCHSRSSRNSMQFALRIDAIHKPFGLE